MRYGSITMKENWKEKWKNKEKNAKKNLYCGYFRYLALFPKL